jgi:rare lipoprotein A
VEFRKSVTAFIIAGVASTLTTAVSQASPEAAASQCGGASWYSLGSRTASGERMSSGALAAAHRSLPFGTHVKVQNLGNGRAVVVRINDRGPFVRGRVIDVTRAAAQELGFIGNGIARVKLTVVDGQGRLSGNCT